MKIITLLFISVATIFGSVNAAEHFDLKAPNGWMVEVQQHQEDGKVFEIWCNQGQEERLVNVTAPANQQQMSLQDAVNAFVLPMQTQGIKHDCVVDGNQALISWLEDDNVAVVKLVLTPYAFHSISYFYQGSNPETVDICLWKDFIKSVELVN